MDAAHLQLFLHQCQPFGDRNTMYAVGIIESDTELFPKTEHLYSFWLTCVDEESLRYVIQFEETKPYRPVVDKVEYMTVGTLLEQQQFYPLSNTDAPATAGLWYVRKAQGFKGESCFRYIICSSFSNTTNLKLNCGVEQGFLKGELTERGDFSVCWHPATETVESNRLSSVLYKKYWLTQTDDDSVHLYSLNTDLSPQAFQITHDNLAHLVGGGDRHDMPHQPERGTPEYYHAYPDTLKNTRYSENYIASLQALDAAGFSLEHRLYLDTPDTLEARLKVYETIIKQQSDEPTYASV